LGLGDDKEAPHSSVENKPIHEGFCNSHSNPHHDKEEQPKSRRPQRTVYMDGVFDLFHFGHLQAIQQCAKLGSRVVIGVTGEADAADYKVPPIVPELECRAIIAALQDVDKVVCPCPLIVMEEFMKTHHIDLVVHGLSNDADAQRQEKFFAIPAHQGKFQMIPYFHGLSTTD
jgi:cytidyltransferase-like protein